MLWLWAAAACLLLMMVPAALLWKDGHDAGLRQQKERPISVRSDRTGDPSGPATNPGQSGRTTGSANSSAPAQASSLAPSSVPGNSSARTKSVVPANALVPAPSSAPAQASVPANSSAQAPSSVPARPVLNQLLARGADTPAQVSAPRPDLSKPLNVLVAATPPKKAQRVVHINELQPSQPTPATATGQRRRPGALRIELSEEPLRPSTTFTEPAEHPILSPNEHLVRWPKAGHQNP